MIEPPAFAELKSRLAHGITDAAQVVYAQCFTRLVAMIRAKMSPKIQAKFDPEDVAQSALGSYLRREANGEYPGVDSWDKAWAVLRKIAAHKYADRWDYYRAARRDVNREVSQESLDRHAWQAVDPHPTPAEAAELRDQAWHLINSFEDPDHRRILLMISRYPVAEVCAVVGCSRRTVYRVLALATLKHQRMKNGERI